MTERPAPPIRVLSAEQQQRDAAEVVGVEVRDQDRVDLVARDAERREPASPCCRRSRAARCPHGRAAGTPTGVARRRRTRRSCRPGPARSRGAPPRAGGSQGWKRPPAKTPSLADAARGHALAVPHHRVLQLRAGLDLARRRRRSGSGSTAARPARARARRRRDRRARGSAKFACRYSAGVPTGSQRQASGGSTTAPIASEPRASSGAHQSSRCEKTSRCGKRVEGRARRRRSPRCTRRSRLHPRGRSGDRCVACVPSDRRRSYRTRARAGHAAARPSRRGPRPGARRSGPPRSRSTTMSPPISRHGSLSRRKAATRAMPPPVSSSSGSREKRSASPGGHQASAAFVEALREVVNVDRHLAHALRARAARADTRRAECRAPARRASGAGP